MPKLWWTAAFGVFAALRIAVVAGRRVERFNDTVETPVWHGYTDIVRRRRNFAMRRVAAPEDIFPVFHDLFSANGVTA